MCFPGVCRGPFVVVFGFKKRGSPCFFGRPYGHRFPPPNSSPSYEASFYLLFARGANRRPPFFSLVAVRRQWLRRFRLGGELRFLRPALPPFFFRRTPPCNPYLWANSRNHYTRFFPIGPLSSLVYFPHHLFFFHVRISFPLWNHNFGASLSRKSLLTVRNEDFSCSPARSGPRNCPRECLPPHPHRFFLLISFSALPLSISTHLGLSFVVKHCFD